MTDEPAEVAVSPRISFARARAAYPTLKEELDKAEWELGVAEAMLEYRFHELLPSPFRAAVEGRQLSGRVVLMVVLAAERGMSLGEGLAAELEGGRLFPAASIARSMMELAGLLVVVRGRLSEIWETDPTNAHALHEETMRFLLASRSMPVGTSSSVVRTADMINAARERYGDAFGEDYGFLSDLVHPNASGAFGLEWLDDAATVAVLRRPPIGEAQAEVLVKILAVGLHSVNHDALWLAEWAQDKDLALFAD